MLRVWDGEYPMGRQNVWQGVFTSGLSGIGKTFERSLSLGHRPALGGMIWLAPPAPTGSPFADKSGRFYVYAQDSTPAGHRLLQPGEPLRSCGMSLSANSLSQTAMVTK